MVKFSTEKSKKKVISTSEKIKKNQKTNKNKFNNKKFGRNAPVLDDLSEQDMNSDDESVIDSFEDESFEDDEEENEENRIKHKFEEKGEEEYEEDDDENEELEENEEEEENEDKSEEEFEDEEEDCSDESSTNEVVFSKNEDESEESNDDEVENDEDIHSSNDEENDPLKQSRRETVKHRKAQIKASESRTVFVGNVPSSTRRREIRKLFRVFGDIEAVYQRTHLQMTDKLTKMMLSKNKELSDRLTSTNFYIRFNKEEDAEKAVKSMNGTKLNKHVLRVTMGAKREFDCKRTIFIGNLPYTALDDSLRAHFRQCGKISGVRLLRDKQTGLTKGFGYVEFSDSNSIIEAIGLNNALFEGRKLRITKAFKKNKLMKMTAKEDNLKRKLPKIPKGAEHFMVLKRGKFDKKDEKIYKNKKEFNLKNIKEEEYNDLNKEEKQNKN